MFDVNFRNGKDVTQNGPNLIANNGLSCDK